MIMIFVKSVGGSTIKDVTIKVADKNDLEFMQGLETLGINRNVARVIASMQRFKSRPSPKSRRRYSFGLHTENIA
jgi:hypothetical protein